MTTLPPQQQDQLGDLLRAAQQLAHADADGAARSLAGSALTLGGAGRVLLIQRQQQHWYVAVEARRGAGGVELQCRLPAAAGAALPVPVRQAIAAGGAGVAARAAALCLPLSARARGAAWLYLEAPTAAGFTLQQGRLVELLAAHADALFIHAGPSARPLRRSAPALPRPAAAEALLRVAMLPLMGPALRRSRASQGEHGGRAEPALAQQQRLESLAALAGAMVADAGALFEVILGHATLALELAGEGPLRRDLLLLAGASEQGRLLGQRLLGLRGASNGSLFLVPVEQVVREAVRVLLGRLPANITLDVRLNAGRATMYGSARALRQIVLQLAANAIDAMPGGGSLRVTLQAASVAAARPASIGLLAAGDYLVLQVADEAVDAAACAEQPPLAAADAADRPALARVRALVLAAGGAIDVSSAAGSCHTVYLPRAGELARAPAPLPAVHAAATATALAPLPRGHGQHIMVVDDEEPLVRLAGQALLDCGYRVSTFTDSLAALAAFRANPDSFDAILSDARMPRMSGPDLIAHLHAHRPALPALLVSAYPTDPALAGSGQPVMKKPLSLAELGEAISRLLAPSH